MLTREDILKRVGEVQVLTNQTDVNTSVILQTMILMQLEELESRLTAIEINTMNGLQNEPTSSGSAGPAPSTASSKTA